MTQQETISKQNELSVSRANFLLKHHGDSIDLEEGELLFSEGDRGDSLYLVETGSIKLTFTDQLMTKILGEGEIFGELSLLLDEEKRSATAQAISNCRLYRLSNVALNQLSQDEPLEVLNIVRSTVRYLLEAERSLIHELTERNQQLTIAYDYLRRTRTELSQLETKAYRDELTDLYNRRSFNEQTKRIRQDNGNSSLYHGLIMIDLDNFKAVNDTLGHDEGDRVLQWTAKAIRDHAGDNDLPCRLGGDEFALLITEPSSALAQQQAQKLLAAINSALQGVQDRLLTVVSASMGLAMVQPDDDEQTRLMKRADQALYQAKQSGKNRVVMADPLQQT